MPLKRLALVALLLAGAAGTAARAASIFDYGHEPDAKIVVEGRTFLLTLHAKRDTIEVRPTVGEAWSASDPTISWTLPVFRSAVETFLAPVGCGVSDVTIIMRPTWEAAFVCPPGVDLHALVIVQRRSLQAGQPLHP